MKPMAGSISNSLNNSIYVRWINKCRVLWFVLVYFGYSYISVSVSLNLIYYFKFSESPECSVLLRSPSLFLPLSSNNTALFSQRGAQRVWRGVRRCGYCSGVGCWRGLDIFYETQPAQAQEKSQHQCSNAGQHHTEPRLLGRRLLFVAAPPWCCPSFPLLTFDVLFVTLC